MQNSNIPCWLTQQEDYTPSKDRESFLTRSTASILWVLSRFKKTQHVLKAKNINTVLRLFGVLLAVVLTSASRNFYFVYVMIAVTAVLLAMCNGGTIKSILRVLVPAEIISLIILIPAAITGSPHTLVSITARVFVTVTIVMRFNLTTPFNKITSALKFFHLPDIIIFTLDLTIQYISILAQICYEMLTALKVRSIGKNTKKSKSVSGILGVTFIKSHQYARVTQQAMECRGFDGSFPKTKQGKLTKYDIGYLAILLILIGVFIYFQVVTK
jgi:cobalt/nickel transport system permease protein